MVLTQQKSKTRVLIEIGSISIVIMKRKGEMGQPGLIPHSEQNRGEVPLGSEVKEVVTS